MLDTFKWTKCLFLVYLFHLEDFPLFFKDLSWCNSDIFSCVEIVSQIPGYTIIKVLKSGICPCKHVLV